MSSNEISLIYKGFLLCWQGMKEEKILVMSLDIKRKHLALKESGGLNGKNTNNLILKSWYRGTLKDQIIRKSH